MVQFLSIFFFLGFLQFLLGFAKVPFFVSSCITSALSPRFLIFLYSCTKKLLLMVGFIVKAKIENMWVITEEKQLSVPIVQNNRYRCLACPRETYIRSCVLLSL